MYIDILHNEVSIVTYFTEIIKSRRLVRYIIDLANGRNAAACIPEADRLIAQIEELIVSIDKELE